MIPRRECGVATSALIGGVWTCAMAAAPYSQSADPDLKPGMLCRVSSHGMDEGRAADAAQLISPMGMQFICTPIHLLALDMCSRPNASQPEPRPIQIRFKPHPVLRPSACVVRPVLCPACFVCPSP